MKTWLSSYFSDRYLAQWVIYSVDIFTVWACFLLATVLRINFEWSLLDIDSLVWQGILCSLVYGVVFLIFQSYNAIMRYASLGDLLKITKTSFYSLFVLFSGSFLSLKFSEFNLNYFQSKSILIIHFFLVVVVLSIGRLLIRALYSSFLNSGSLIKKRVLIYGAGESGLITLKTLRTSTVSKYQVVAFIDDNISLHGKCLEGVKIYKSEHIYQDQFIQSNQISEMIIAIQNIHPDKKKKIIEFCLTQKIEAREVPSHDQWIKGELSAKQIKPVAVEDLLGRGVISLNNPAIHSELKNKIVLITGGAGSIGSEIVRQVIHFQPKHVIIIDQAESVVFELDHQISTLAKNKGVSYSMVIGSVRDETRMRGVISDNVPDIIFHSAAYKHVPLMEDNPLEAISTNVMGTKILADLAIEFEVSKFVLISTDKAVNPTNVMGATKRMAEIYIQCKSSQSSLKTQFVTTRFGNVLGSNGSVIPLFRNQIEQGGPVTITDKKITRFFMTIPEACNLVLEAGVMGHGGEIFIFDMGKSVKIYDLALKMIQLSGLEIGKEIDIEVTGLRPGEKLYEELMLDGESCLPTHHPKIHISKLKKECFEQLKDSINELESSLRNQDVFHAVGVLKNIIPEYKSNNSDFEVLDSQSETQFVV